MDLRGDERGQPVLIGAILLFAMLVLAFATYQGAVVPSQNAEVEYNHFQVVEGQFSDLRTSATNAIGSGEQRSVTISLGTRYPARLIALNPSAPSGSLETTGEGAVEIEGLDHSAADLCATDADNITSRSLRYTPSYHEHRSAESITFENTFRARSFRDGETQFDGQSLVQPPGGGEATKVNLMVLTGSFSRSSGDSFDLDLNPTHRYGVDVSNESFNVTVPSRFSADLWENQILAEANISSVEQVGDRVKIRLPEGDYRISCAALGLNSQPAYQPPGGNQAEPVFDTRWQEDNTIIVSPSDNSLKLSMIARDEDSGAGISNASVDYSFSSTESNTGVISFEGLDNGMTNSSGANSTRIDISAAENEDIYDLFVTAGDDSDVITVKVEQTMAERFEIKNPDGSNNPSEVEFTGENTGTQDVVMTEIRVDSTDTSATKVDFDNNAEFSGDADYLNLDGALEIGAAESTPLDNEATIGGQDSELYKLREFRDDNDNDVGNMKSQEVTITIVFQDGSKLTETMNT